MPAPRIISPIVPPAVEMAYDRYESEWPPVWLIYGDLDEGWKDPYVSSVFVRIDGSHLTGDDVYREYRVRAIKVETAIERAVELIQSPYALCVAVYKVRLPLSAAEVGSLEAINADIQRDPAWGAFKTSRRSRALGTAPRPDRHHRNLSPQRRRSLSVGMR
jgi:hypothetical protein